MRRSALLLLMGCIAAAQGPSPTPLSLRVEDAEARPLPGAVVRLPSAAPWSRGESGRPQWVTDRTGRVGLPNSLLQDPVWVLATHPQGGMGMVRIDPATRDGATPETLVVCVPPLQFEFCVRDGRGAPVEGLPIACPDLAACAISPVVWTDRAGRACWTLPRRGPWGETVQMMVGVRPYSLNLNQLPAAEIPVQLHELDQFGTAEIHFVDSVGRPAFSEYRVFVVEYDAMSAWDLPGALQAASHPHGRTIHGTGITIPILVPGSRYRFVLVDQGGALAELDLEGPPAGIRRSWSVTRPPPFATAEVNIRAGDGEPIDGSSLAFRIVYDREIGNRPPLDLALGTTRGAARQWIGAPNIYGTLSFAVQSGWAGELQIRWPGVGDEAPCVGRVRFPALSPSPIAHHLPACHLQLTLIGEGRIPNLDGEDPRHLRIALAHTGDQRGPWRNVASLWRGAVSSSGAFRFWFPTSVDRNNLTVVTADGEETALTIQWDALETSPGR